MEGQENITRFDEPAPGSEGSRQFSGRYFDGRRIFRVPYHVRRENEQDYIPRIVSFGPYHQGSHELRLAEELKPKIVKYFVSESGKDRQFFYDKVFQVIHEIRLCYDEVIINKYNDASLAEMMLRDAFFIIYKLKEILQELEPYPTALILHDLGVSGFTLLHTDMYVLENQIPLSIINLFASLICDEDQGSKSLVLRYFIKSLQMNELTEFPFVHDEKQPLHLLDAQWRLSVGTPKPVGVQLYHMQDQERNYTDMARHRSSPFRSVTDLKTKGIYFKSNSFQATVREIQFRSWKFFGELQLPAMTLNTNTKVIYSNLIAFEVSPGGTYDLLVTSYINFMKSLIVSPKDVRELREKEILFSTEDNDEIVMKQIKSINTHGWDDPNIFNQVKEKINKHCNSRMGRGLLN